MKSWHGAIGGGAWLLLFIFAGLFQIESSAHACLLTYSKLASLKTPGERAEILAAAYRQLLQEMNGDELRHLAIDPLSPPRLEPGRSEIERTLGEIASLVEPLALSERAEVKEKLRALARAAADRQTQNGGHTKTDRDRSQTTQRDITSPLISLHQSPRLIFPRLLDDGVRVVSSGTLIKLDTPMSSWPTNPSSSRDEVWTPDSFGKYALEIKAQQSVPNRWIDLSTYPARPLAQASIPVPLDALPAKVSEARFSRDGKRLVLHHGGTARGFALGPQSYTAGPEIKNVSLVKGISVDGNFIWVHAHVGPTEVSPLRRIDLRDGAIVAQTDLPLSLSQFSVAPDGTHVLAQFPSKVTSPSGKSQIDVRTLDARTGETLAVDTIPRGTADHVYLLENRGLALSAPYRAKEIEILAFAPKRIVGKLRLSSTFDAFESVSLSPNGKRILIQMKDARDRSSLAVYDLDHWLRSGIAIQEGAP